MKIKSINCNPPCLFFAMKEAFRIYHEGYSEQLKKWPKDPLNIIINAIVKK